MKVPMKKVAGSGKGQYSACRHAVLAMAYLIAVAAALLDGRAEESAASIAHAQQQASVSLQPMSRLDAAERSLSADDAERDADGHSLDLDAFLAGNRGALCGPAPHELYRAGSPGVPVPFFTHDIGHAILPDCPSIPSLGVQRHRPSRAPPHFQERKAA